MTFEEAIKLLGLNQNFTKEELDNAYRKMVKMCHPDKFEQTTDVQKKKANAKMQKINLARDFLKSYLNSNKQKKDNFTPYNKTGFTSNFDFINFMEICVFKLQKKSC